MRGLGEDQHGPDSDALPVHAPFTVTDLTAEAVGPESVPAAGARGRAFAWIGYSDVLSSTAPKRLADEEYSVQNAPSD